MSKSNILSDDSFLVFFKAKYSNVFTIYCPPFVVVLYSYELHTMGNQPDLVSFLISVTVSFCHYRYRDIYNGTDRRYQFHTNFLESHAGLYHFRNLFSSHKTVCLLIFLF